LSDYWCLCYAIRPSHRERRRPLGSVTVPITVPEAAVCALAGCEMVESIKNSPSKKEHCAYLFHGSTPFHIRKLKEIDRERSAGTRLRRHAKTQRRRYRTTRLATPRPPHSTNLTTRRVPTPAGAFPPKGEKNSVHICQVPGLGQDNLSNIPNRSRPLASANLAARSSSI